MDEVSTMTCEDYEQILMDSSFCVNDKDWILGVSVMNLAKSHTQNCPACAAKMSDVAKLKDALDQLRVTTMHMEAPAAVEASLLAAFRREMARRDPSVPRIFLWKLVWGPAAALLLVVAGVVLYSLLRSRSPATVQIERNHSEQLAQRQISPTISVATGRAVVESRRPDTVHAVTRGSGVVSAKVHEPIHKGVGRRSPTPAADELSLNGGSSVVRVTLPLSSLVAMGVPVHPDISDPRVTADVVMDPFGAVMAIRLVEAKPSVN
jgi:anti-sigma factor RsiW